MNKNKGFTLVELMVVIVIIGILAALAIPRFLGASSKTKATEFKPVLKQIYTLQEAYKQEADAFGTDVQIGFEDPKSDYYLYAVVNGAVPAKGVHVQVGTATPDNKGLSIKVPSTGDLLTVADMVCVNDEGQSLSATANMAELAGSSVPEAGTFATCTP